MSLRIQSPLRIEYVVSFSIKLNKAIVVPPIILLAIICATLMSCRREGGDTLPPVPPSTNGDRYDISANGIPKIPDHDYIELSKLHRISRFRSSVGHDYWDNFEQCRSMKHYFQPQDTIDWSTVNISAPLKGNIFRIVPEWAGSQIQIRSDVYPAFYFSIFHVNLSNPLMVGDTVDAGQELGTHIGSQTMSDIAVGVNTPTGWKLISYFDVMTDSVFFRYQSRGVNTRADAIISKAARDADSLRCNGDTFLNTGTIDNWVILN